MSSELEKLIVAKIKELPTLPIVTSKLIALSRDANSSAGDLTQIIQSDQALVSKVLKLVNSAFYGFPRKITTISRAVVILGFNAIRNLAISLSTFDVLKAIKVDTDWDAFWNHAMATAAGMHVLFAKFTNNDPEEGFTLGMIHDIGHLMLFYAIQDKYAKLLEKPYSDIKEHEYSKMKIDHTIVAAKLLEHWQLPDDFVSCIKSHHNYLQADLKHRPKLTLLMLSDAIATLKGFGFLEKPNPKELANITSTLNISGDVLDTVLKELDSRFEDFKEFLKVANESATTVSSTQQFSLSTSNEMKSIVLIGVSRARLLWPASILRNAGHHVTIIDDLSKIDLDPDTTDLVLLDYNNINKQTAQGVCGKMLSKKIRTAFLVEKEHEIPTQENMAKQFFKIPFLFSVELLDALLMTPLEK